MDETDRMVAAVEEVTGTSLVPPVDARRLAGGFAWRTWLLADAAGEELVVRVAPAGGTMEPYRPEHEAVAVAAAGGSVPAPEYLGVSDGGAMGAPFSVARRVAGAVLRLGDVTGDDRPAYRHAFAVTLGRLHRGGDPEPLGDAATCAEAWAAELDRMADEYRRVALHRQPGLEIGLALLHRALPGIQAGPVLCHGDFRFANLTWTGPGELGAVLDWERAWVGDPMADVAFTRLFSGWCAVAGDAVPVYEEASGLTVDEDRVAYGLRFERVRAYLSPLRVMRAVHEGRVSDPSLVALAEAGEAGMWELASWGPPVEVADAAPPADGPDWTDRLTDPELRRHFDAHPRPRCVDPSDPGEVAATAAAWATRPLLRSRRRWE